MFVINLQRKELEMATRKQTHYRDSNNGQFLKKTDAERKNPATVEKEVIKYPQPTKKK